MQHAVCCSKSRAYTFIICSWHTCFRIYYLISMFTRPCGVDVILHITAAFELLSLEICWNKSEMKIRLCENCQRRVDEGLMNNERLSIMLRQLARERSVATIACCL